MWYLKYRYEDKEGKSYSRSSLLECGIEYSLGRASRNLFKVDKPSVSAIHLKFIIDPIDFPMRSPVLKLKIIGQSATINDNMLNLSKLPKEERENAEFMEFNKNIHVKISGVVIKFFNKPMLFKVNNELALEYKPGLKKLGIPFTTTYLPETTHLIKQKADNSLDVLAALLYQIPIVTPKFIDKLIDRSDSLIENYEKNVPNFEDYILDELYIPNKERPELLQNLLFMFFDENQFNYLTPILKISDTKVELFNLKNKKSKDVIEFINDLKTEKNIIIVQPDIKDEGSPESVKIIETLNNVVKALSIYLITNEDIFNSVLNLNIDILTRKRPIKSPSTVINDTLQPHKKKRRVKIKALDSLDFFGGGNSVSQVPDPLKKDVEMVILDDDEEPQPPAKKLRSKIKPMSNQLIESIESLDMKLSRDEIIEIQSSQPLEEKKAENEKEENKIEKAEIAEPKSITKQHSFLVAAQNTKEEANKRIADELGHIENIDADTIDSLRDLAIVEKYEIPLREQTNAERNQESTLQNQMKQSYWDPKWTGRKNFKNFSKSTKRINSDNNFIQTHIRDYVPMNLVSVEKIRIKGPDDELLESNERHQQEEMLKEQSADGSFNKRAEALFVEDSDLEDEQQAGFQFTTDIGGIHNADGLGMNIRVTENENSTIPEYRRFNSNPEKNITIINNDNNDDDNSLMINDSDEEDDDDDVPRFKFRS